MDTPTDRPPKRSTWFGLALRFLSLTLVAALLGLLVWRVVDVGRGGRLVSAVREHKSPKAPNFRLKMLWSHSETWDAAARAAFSDGQIALSALRGQPVVINFWASWCVPCRREAPRLAASAKAHRGAVVFLGVDVKDFASDARRFLRRYNVNYVSVRDRGSSTYEAYGLTGLPETYFLDSRGRIVAHVVGEISRSSLEDGLVTATRSGS